MNHEADESPAGKPPSDISQEGRAGRDVYQAARDQYIYNSPRPGGFPKTRKRKSGGRHPAATAVLAAAAVATGVIVLAWQLTGSPGAPVRATGSPPSVPVGRGLLDSSELSGLDLTLKQTDLQLPAIWGAAACGKGKVHPLSTATREFSESPRLFLTEMIEEFPSRDAAKNAYRSDSGALACGFSTPKNNITGEVSGLGDAGYAEEVHYSSGGLTESAYVGAMLFGRYVLILAMQTPLDNSFDQVSAFTLYSYAAAHKIQALPGAA